MFQQVCKACGKFTWHNPCAKADRPTGRCTYCGQPADTGNATSDKREFCRLIHTRQVARVRLV